MEKLLIKISKMNILEKIKNSPKLTKLNEMKRRMTWKRALMMIGVNTTRPQSAFSEH